MARIDCRDCPNSLGQPRLAALPQTGVQPEVLLGLLAWSCGWLTRIEPISARALVPLFRLAAIPPRRLVLEGELLRQIGYPGTTEKGGTKVKRA